MPLAWLEACDGSLLRWLFWLVACDQILAWLSLDNLCPWFLDVDAQCALAYHLTFGASLTGPDLSVQLDDDDDMPLCRVVEHDILEFDWVHLVGRGMFELGVCSPPCPPWAKAVSSPRPSSQRWCIDPLAVALMALVGCKAFCLENVSGLLQHDQFLGLWLWPPRWSCTSETWNSNPDATLAGDDGLNPHVWTVWPRVCPPSSRQFDVLTAASGHWLDECRPSNEVLGMYLDPSNLPRLANSQRHAKRSKVDVISYRLRTPEDQFSCSMANYGEGHNLPPPTVRAGGLYRALLGLPLASGLPVRLRFCCCRSHWTRCGSQVREERQFPSWVIQFQRRIRPRQSECLGVSWGHHTCWHRWDFGQGDRIQNYGIFT